MAEFDVKRIVKITYEPNFHSSWHKHSFFHCIFVLSGNGVIKIEDTRYSFQSKELYLICPEVYHEIASVSDHEFRSIEIKFDVKDRHLFSDFCKLPQVIKVQHSQFRITLEAILAEAEAQRPYYSSLINALFSAEMFRLLRITNKAEIENYRDCYDTVSSMKPNDLVKSVIDCIEENITKEISVVQIASMIGISASHLSAMFKTKTGISIKQCIMQMRMSKAKAMMVNTNLNITQIAEEIGFSSVHYFSNFFKKVEGITPNTYIKKMKGDIRIDIDTGHLPNMLGEE